MNSVERERGLQAFLEQVLQVLQEGRRTATYKYSLLLAIIDVMIEQCRSSGEAPETISTAAIARKVLALYWPQALPFEGRSVLRQNSKGQAEILRKVTAFRTRWAPDAYLPYWAAEAINENAYARLQEFVEWKLIEMPIPRLQRVGKSEYRFLYTYGWLEGATKADLQRGKISRVLQFTKPARTYLPSLGPLLRPLIHRQWTSAIVGWNENLREVQNLEEFLFGKSRVPTSALLPDLRELQEGRCFYCRETIARSDTAVDHFIPWARYPDDGLANLVVADRKCNSKKRDFLAATGHLDRWIERIRTRSDDLAVIAQAHRWDDATARMRHIATAMYTPLPEEYPLWNSGDNFEPCNRAQIQEILAEAGG
ncbi:MAG: HNH endonuclease domain-containing protein [Pseudomonadota bacterium]